MITIIEKAISRLHSEIVLEKAAHILKNGGLVAFPTETVYGLGGNAYDGSVAKKIYEAKGRPSDNPLIVHISRIEMLFEVCSQVSGLALKMAELFWPGPLTMILPKSDKIPLETTGGLDTVAVRYPRHKTAISLIDKCGFPLSAPSANSSGKPSPTRASHVIYDLSGKIDMIIDSGPCEIGLESTIVDLTGDIPVVLRPGYISEQQINDAIKTIVKNKFETENDDEAPKAPGMKYRHYSPKADLTIVAGGKDEVAKKINEMTEQFEKKGIKVGILATDETKNLYKDGHIISVGSIKNMEEIAQNLFKTLRKFDFYGLDVVLSESFASGGIGSAVMNRLEKASGHKVIEVGGK